MTLMPHKNAVSICLMCSGQIIYKPRISGHCQYITSFQRIIAWTNILLYWINLDHDKSCVPNLYLDNVLSSKNNWTKRPRPKTSATHTKHSKHNLKQKPLWKISHTENCHIMNILLKGETRPFLYTVYCAADKLWLLPTQDYVCINHVRSNHVRSNHSHT